MRALRLHEFGKPEVLRVDYIPVPEPGPGEILVRVGAASLNPVDYKMRRGGYPQARPEQLPLTLGRDLAGVVERSTVPDFAPGDEVYGHLEWGQGAQAEFALVNRRGLARKPREASFIKAAAVPLAATTAWQGLFTHGGLRTGQSVLIQGASGGVGGFAVQLAKAHGAAVHATASGEGVALVKEYGADQVIDYKRENFEDAVPMVDMVLDLVGGEVQKRSWKVLKPGGAMISTLEEPDRQESAARRAKAMRYMAEPDAGQLAQIARLVDEGGIQIVISKTYQLEQAAEAHRLLEKSHPPGKAVFVTYETASKEPAPPPSSVLPGFPDPAPPRR